MPARVCRSTFAADVMSAPEGWEEGLALRAFMYAALHPDVKVTEAVVRSTFLIVSITDCKSV